MRHHLVKAKSVRTGLRKLRLYYLGTALSNPKHSSLLSETQLLHILCTGYERAVFRSSAGTLFELNFQKNTSVRCTKIILGINHVYGGYCL